MTDLDTKVAALAEMSLAELKDLWHRLHGAAAPRLSPELMRLALAYRIQDRGDGRLTRKNERRLQRLHATRNNGDQVRTPAGVQLKSGATLVREWQGRSHTVVVQDGGFSYRDRHYRSLSAIDREITGARWCGACFFGLRRASTVD